ncbi:MAG: hypothetical protein Q4B18_00255 [Bacillota bacterium]|nr:hypothetical protein [Bacillota bacterium]
MGVWLRAEGRLEVVPPPDEKLMVEFWVFSNNTWPEDYRRMDEYFEWVGRIKGLCEEFGMGQMHNRE